MTTWRKTTNAARRSARKHRPAKISAARIVHGADGRPVQTSSHQDRSAVAPTLTITEGRSSNLYIPACRRRANAFGWCCRRPSSTSFLFRRS